MKKYCQYIIDSDESICGKKILQLTSENFCPIHLTCNQDVDKSIDTKKDKSLDKSLDTKKLKKKTIFLHKN